MTRRTVITALALALALIVAGVPGAGHASVPTPTVTDPPAGLRGHALWDSWYALGELGYEEAEYFVSGDARSLATPGLTAPYTTRVIVTRPISSDDFNGTVLLDWVNVTAQFENAVDTLEAHEMLVREGFAFVHVSAQAAGICCSPLTPKVWDPVRYAALNHPGDDYAFDMFSQVAQAVRAVPKLMGALTLSVERIIAAGQSQSASRLDTYVRQVQPGAGVIDGFLIHGGGSKTYPAPPPVPVLHLLSDAEAAPAAPNQTQNYRLWEIAGSAHSDFWLDYHQEIGQGPRVLADAPQQPASADEDLHAVAGNYGEQIHPRQLTCIAGGSLFPMRYATSAALHHLDIWVRTGVAPPEGPRFSFAGGTLALDEFHNALGGIRLPPIEVPTATYLSTVCELGGITIPFTEVQLAMLYPTHADYFCAIEAATTASVAAGFLLQPDADDLLARADEAKNRWVDPGAPGCA
jgi:alpha/beta hydrolase family protein